MKNLVKPPKLKLGDTVAAINLSNGWRNSFQHRYEIGKERLEKIFNLNVKPTRNALKSSEWLHKNPKARAEDLMEAFSDPTIKGIISIIGGDDSIRLIPFIDYKTLKNNPKVFLGFSDTTVSHYICLKAGISSFYGPAIISNFAENIEMHKYTLQGVRRTLFSNNVIGEIPENEDGWTSQFLDWSIKENNNIRRALNPFNKQNFIYGTYSTKGRLIGGCIEVLQFINGTDIWPNILEWEDTILFLETSEEGIQPLALERIMRNFGMQGILSKIKGILFGRPGGHRIHPRSFKKYDMAIIKVLNEFGIFDLPVVTNMNIGHTEPIWTLPYGCLTKIDVEKCQVMILENAVT